MAGIEPAVEVHAVSSAPRKFVGGLHPGIAAAAAAAPLVAAEPCHHAAGPAAGTDDHPEIANRGRIQVVVRPVVAFFNTNGRFRTAPIRVGFGHHLSRPVELLDINAGHFCRLMRLCFPLLVEPRFPIFKPLGLKLAPGGAPLPRGIASALTKTGIGFPLVVRPVPNKVLIFPAVFENDAGNRHMDRSIRARKDIEPQTAVRLRVGHSGRAPGHDHNHLGVIRVDPLDDPFVPGNGFALEGVCAGDQEAIGQG